MAIALFKFRCSQCQKLLGVSHSRAGTRVNCPRCNTELIVPEPSGEHEVAEEGSTVPDLSAIGLSTLDGLGSIRPEDLRVLPGIGRVDDVPAPSRGASAPSWVPDIATEPGPAIPALRETTRPAASRRDDLAPDEIGDILQAVQAAQIASPGRSEPDGPDPAHIREPEVATAVELEAPTIRPAGAPRRNDVAVPRSALIAWSFSAVLAIASAFFAGLLAGHFVWK